MNLPPLVEEPDWPGRLASWRAGSAIETPYGSFDVKVACPRGGPPSGSALERAATLATFTRENIETIVDLAYAYFRSVYRNWGDEVFKLMEIPLHDYTRSNILRVARHLSVSVTMNEEDKLLWWGVSIGVDYDEEHGLGLEFDGSSICSINGDKFVLCDGELSIIDP
jgi:hypothetical protein